MVTSGARFLGCDNFMLVTVVVHYLIAHLIARQVCGYATSGQHTHKVSASSELQVAMKIVYNMTFDILSVFSCATHKDFEFLLLQTNLGKISSLPPTQQWSSTESYIGLTEKTGSVIS